MFQITEEDVERSSSLDKNDIGKWCFIIAGTYQGFCNTREEAEEKMEICDE